MDTTELTDEQLAAEAAREGSDGPAFVALLERYRDRVWHICYRLVGNAEDARDVAQEVFVQLFLQREKFGERSKYSTWVYGIAVRRCLMWRRSAARRRAREARVQPAENQQRAASIRDKEIALDLMHMLEVLDEEDRALLILKYAEAYSYEELGTMFDLSVSACKMRISRAREKLKSHFPEHEFGGTST